MLNGKVHIYSLTKGQNLLDHHPLRSEEREDESGDVKSSECGLKGHLRPSTSHCHRKSSKSKTTKTLSKIEDPVSSLSYLYTRIQWPHLEDMEALEEDVVGFEGEEVGEVGKEGMEDHNCRHLFLNKLMPNMVRIRSFWDKCSCIKADA